MIRIELYYNIGLFNDDPENKVSVLDKLVIIDNGNGLNEDSYSRLLTLRDDSKSIRNKGTGRIQFAHYFEDTVFDSIYNLDEHKRKHLVITLSKKDIFLKNNAILRKDLEEDVVDDMEPYTKVTFSNLLDSKKDGKLYNSISLDILCGELRKHFLSLFCENRNCLPDITIVRYEDKKVVRTLNITPDVIPTPDNITTVKVKYSKIDERNKILDVDHEESFTLYSFIQPANDLKNNSIFYVSNGALAQENPIDSIQKKDVLDGNRYMFLLTGSYFDSVDDDLRGNLHLVKENDFKRQNEETFFPEECLLSDRIEEKTNAKINL